MTLGDFETQKKNLQEQIKTAESEAEFTLDMTDVERLNKDLEKLEATKHLYESKVETAEQNASPDQVKQITDLGGTEEVLAEKLVEKNEEVKEVEVSLQKTSEELENDKEEGVDSENSHQQEAEEQFDVQKRIKEITGGSEKLERFGRGYDNFLNMYTSALQDGNIDELKKYEEIFSQVGILGDIDKINIQERVVQNTIHNTLSKWDDSFGKQEFQEKFKSLTNEIDPEIVNLGVGNELFSLHNMNTDDVNKLKEILGGIDNEKLFRSLQLAKENRFSVYKQQEQEKIKRETDFINERLELEKDPIEQEKLKKRLSQNIQNIQNERIQKESITEKDYQKKLVLLSN